MIAGCIDKLSYIFFNISIYICFIINISLGFSRTNIRHTPLKNILKNQRAASVEILVFAIKSMLYYDFNQKYNLQLFLCRNSDNYFIVADVMSDN